MFFKAADGTEHKTTRHLSVNKPCRLIARVPATLSAGKVTVIVRTEFAGSGKPLKELREIIYGYPCTSKSRQIHLPFRSDQGYTSERIRGTVPLGSGLPLRADQTNPPVRREVLHPP